jgi:cobalt-zinc-cadmium efflux system protein
MSDNRHLHVSDLRSAQSRALRLALIANAIYLVVEIVGGLVFSSLALLADAAHMLSDVAGLGIALIAQALLTRPASARHTFGLQRAEVLGAQVNGLLLAGGALWIVLEAVRRIGDPPEVSGAGLMIVAAVGLAVNVGSAVTLARAGGRSLNIRAALVHMVADAGASVATIAAGAAVLLWNANLVDPLISVGIAALVLYSAWKLLRDTTQVLMEGAPEGLDVVEVERTLAQEEGVESVHHLHLWNIASDVPALSAHVVLRDDVSLHDAQLRGERLKDALRSGFGIEHATLELECHPCGPEEGAEDAHRKPSLRS